VAGTVLLLLGLGFIMVSVLGGDDNSVTMEVVGVIREFFCLRPYCKLDWQRCNFVPGSWANPSSVGLLQAEEGSVYKRAGRSQSHWCLLVPRR